MPIETKPAPEAIEKLTNYYNSLSTFWRFFLIPSLRGKALTTQTPLEIFKLANTFVFWFVSGIYNLFRSNPLSFFSDPHVSAWNRLQKNNLLDRDDAEKNFNTILQLQDPTLLGVTWALDVARSANLLTKEVAQANFNAITQHKNPVELASALNRAHQYGLLTGDVAQKIFDAILHPDQAPWNIMSTLSTAHWAGLLTGDLAEKNIDAIMRHQNISTLRGTLNDAREIGLLTGDVAQKNFNTILQHQNLEDLFWALGGANVCTSTLRKTDGARLRTKGEAKMLAINAEHILQSQDPLKTARAFYGTHKTTKPLTSSATVESTKPETKTATPTTPKEKDMKFFGSTSPAPSSVSKNNDHDHDHDNDNDHKSTI